MLSTGLESRSAVATTVLPASARNTIPATTPRSCSIPTATTSKPSATTGDRPRSATRRDRGRARPGRRRLVRPQRTRGALARARRSRLLAPIRGVVGLSAVRRRPLRARARRADRDVPLGSKQEDFFVVAGEALLLIE